MISAVIPLFNEQDNLEILYQRLVPVLKKIDKVYEIIFIDDGSKDNSLKVLQTLAKKDNTIRIFSFRRNLGKSEALTIGFQKAKGDYIVTLDADLQDRPEEIEKLYKKVNEGSDMASGWRKNRKDKSIMISASRVFNTITRFLWGLQLHDYNCGLKMYTKELASTLKLYGGMHRFIPLLAYQQGFNIVEIEVNHDKRLYGKSKYGFSKVFKDLPDIFTIFFLSRFSKRPLHFFGTVGSILLFLGIIFLGYLTYLHFFLNEKVGTRPLWSVGILFALVGIQIFFTGFLADLFINISQNYKQTNYSEGSYIKYSSDKE